jgi:hypothetical protein
LDGVAQLAHDREDQLSVGHVLLGLDDALVHGSIDAGSSNLRCDEGQAVDEVLLREPVLERGVQVVKQLREILYRDIEVHALDGSHEVFLTNCVYGLAFHREDAEHLLKGDSVLVLNCHESLTGLSKDGIDESLVKESRIDAVTGQEIN